MRTEINKKSDFDFIVLDSEGNAINMPSNDFTLDIWTWGSKCRFRASSIGGVLKGCNNDGGKLRVYVDNPGFVPGKLVGEWVSYISSEEYQDGTQRTCRYISDFGIDMVDGDSQTNEVQVLAMMQYIQGASAYEIACENGFEGTEQEWLDSVALPAVEAAAECKALIVELNDAEAQRVANEDVRTANEGTRVQQESARVSAEEQRTKAEAERRIAENTRELVETTRQNAERNRTNAEATRVEAENARKTAEDARIANESTWQTNEQARVAAEANRESAETDRAEAEAARVEAEAARAEEFAGFTATLAAKEDAANKVTSINADATDKQYPSAKAVRNAIGVVATEVNNNRVLFDVSAAYPTGGTDGTDNYTIETAIAAVPSDLQLNVRYLTFKISDTERELWQFNGIRTTSLSQFGAVDKWNKMRPSMYHDLEYNTNINTIRNSVPVSERVSGLIIHYTTPEGEDKYEMYVGENNALREKFWENFVPIYVASNIDSQIKKSVTPIYVESRNGKFHNAIKELYLEKYEEGKQYIITQFSYNENNTNGSIWVSYEGASNLYSTVSNNSVGGINGGIVTLESTDKSFRAHLIIDWSKIGYIYNDMSINLYLTEACKNIENSPTIYSKLSMAQIDYKASVGAGLESRLYNDSETIVFEDAAEQAGDVNYGHINIGLIHKAAKQEKFNAVYAQLWKSSTDEITTGNLVVKRGFAVSASGGTIIKEIDNFSNESLPPSGLYEIKLGQDVTLETNEYLWVYYTGRLTMRTWTANNEEGTRVGMYFQGRISTYRYSSAIVLKQLKGDIIGINERLSEVEAALGTGGDDKISSPLITLPDDLYVAVGREQTFYYNEFIFGIESSQDNTLTNYNIEATLSPSGLGRRCVSSKEGFAIYTYTQGDYTLTVSVYDQYNNLLVSKISTLHSFNAQSSTGKSILMLGASWIDINSGNRGYPYLNEALNEMGITANFIGTRDAGTSGLKHEGIGGYTWKLFVSKPTDVRFKFFVDSMPSISTDDIYSNNGSTYKLIERGSNYLTLSRESGSTEPSGDTLKRVSGTGDESIAFTSWTIGGSNPLWNTIADALDFTHYRSDLCGLSTPLDVCNIQLGINDCLSPLKTTEAEWSEMLNSVTTLLDAILADSPNCKIVVNLVGMDFNYWLDLISRNGRKYETKFPA